MKKIFAMMLLAALALAACTGADETAEDLAEAVHELEEDLYELQEDLQQAGDSAVSAVSPDEWSIELDGRRLPIADYQFALGYLQLMNVFGELPIGIDPQEQALVNLKDLLLLEEAAQRHDAEVSDDELEGLRMMAEEILDMMPMLGVDAPQISQERAVEIMALEFLKWELAPYYTGGMPVDQQALAEARDDFMTNNRRYFTEAAFRFTTAENTDDAQRYHAEIIAAAPGEISETLLRLEAEEAAAAGEEPLPDDRTAPSGEMEDLRAWVSMGFLEAADVEAITHMQAGEITAPIPIMDGSYVIFVIDSLEVDDSDDRLEEFSEHFIALRRAEAFEEILADWRADADFVLNQPIIDAVNAQ